MKKLIVISSVFVFAFAMVLNLQWAAKDSYGLKSNGLHAQVLGQLEASGTGATTINLGNSGYYTNWLTGGGKMKPYLIHSGSSSVGVSFSVIERMIGVNYSETRTAIIGVNLLCGWADSGRCDLSKECIIIYK